jgi:DNA-binding MarR family transcriptional regulator
MKQSQSEQSLSSPSRERLVAWRTFWETALWLLDVLDTEMQRDAGIPLRWYDVLVHAEESPDGVRMNDLADQILTSKSGLTRVIDRMEEAGLVARVRPEGDRRVILVQLTAEGTRVMEHARAFHRHGIEQYFARHLSDDEIESLARALGKVREAVRPARPGRISG